MKRNKKKIFLYAGIVIICLVIFSVVELISIIHDLPRPEKITSFQPVQSTKIYDRTGQVLLYEIHGEQNRTIIPADQIPEYMKKAVIAVEDQGFYDHAAFDIRGIFRALLEDLRRGEFVQGGSTITQQLVKNVFLTPEKTISRKVKELILAYWIEKQYTKDEILVYYLNQSPFGSNAYGIEEASHLYFGTPTKDISVAEAATLAALLQSPSYYSPWGKHVGELLSRKNYALQQMKNLGYITPEQYTAAMNEKIAFQPESYGKIKAPHFSLMIKDYLVNKYGEEEVENGGLKVITTLDWKKQEAAERIVKDGAAQNSKNYKGSNAALMAEDPKTGQILALVGSADYFDASIDGNFNVITQGLRQPGSTFKPIVYLSAFMKGYTPDTVVFDTPTEFSLNSSRCPVVVNFNNSDPACFHPQNYEGTFSGPITLKQALAQSINVPAVKVLYLTGLSNAIGTAEKLGITTLEDQSRFGLSLVLGGGEVRPMEIIHAYTAFAEDGVQHAQASILSVQDSKGNTLEEFKDEAKEVIDPQYIRMVNSILSNLDLRSGLFHASLPLTVFNGYDVALKTGTTNDYRDAWTIGYTPFLTVGVWAGNNNNNAMVRQGGSILAALPMWSNFMREFISDYQPEPFPTPDPIISPNPALNGQYVITIPNKTSPQVHNILYYLDKDDPKDLLIGNTTDPQFQNWEIPALTWAREHIPNFDSQYNK